MSYYSNRKQATTADIEAATRIFRSKVEAAFPGQFDVNSNGYGVHVRCITCGESATHDRGYRFPWEHPTHY